MGALSDIVRSGKALYVGLSNYKEEETRKAVKILKENGTPCLIHQPRYNMLERWVEDGLLSALDENGVGCICFSPLAQGALTDKYLKGIPVSQLDNSLAALECTGFSENELKKIDEILA